VRFAQILYGKAHWIFEADKKPRFAPNIVLVDITDQPDIQEGWIYDESTQTFTEPEYIFEDEEEDFEQRESIDEKVERLEKEQLITMTALVEKHEETLALKKMNEKLQEMNLIALQGVAELNGEVQKLKKEMGASAD